MQISAEFVTSAAGADDFPRDGLAEIALVGRSNVGKSSLINALLRRKLARTSVAPGKTRLVNFYRVRQGSAPAFYLVDLPGYGYARGGDAAAREFDRLTEAYFDRSAASGSSRPSTSLGAALGVSKGRKAHDKRIAVILLVDARHPGLESDIEAWEWLKSKPCSRGVVGTKGDKLTRAERDRHARQFQSLFDGPVVLVSARTGEGLEELWKMIARLPNQTAA